MQPASPQTKFLLRGSALLIALLILWWFALLDPLLSVLRWSAGVAGGQAVSLTAAGDWTFRFTAGGRLAEFDMPRTDVIAFTFSLPVFWALLLAAGDLRRSVRPLIIGTALVAVAETLMLLALARLAGRNIAARMAPNAQDALSGWLANVGEHLIVSVLPYVTPFVIALALHRGLRSQILPFAAPVPQKTAAAPAKNAPRRLRR